MAQPTDAFEKHVTEFERAVASALIPGECELWINAAREAAAVMAIGLRGNIQHHAEVMDSVLRETVDLQPRIESLRQQDVELEKALDRISAKLDEVAAECVRTDTSDEPLRMTKALRFRLLRWVQRARILESELVAWVLETTHRDMGVGD